MDDKLCEDIKKLLDDTYVKRCLVAISKIIIGEWNQKELFAIAKTKVKEVKNKELIRGRISNSMRKALKSNGKSYFWEELLGYDLNRLRTHLVKLFKEGMTWEKFLNGEIHIDHVIPVSLWEFETINDREVKQCWALCNLQPLWARDNVIKGNRV